jgi:hypothetical protein
MSIRNYLPLLLLVITTQASAQLFQKYQSREDCVNRELQRYSAATDAALIAATRFCNEYFVKIEIEQIKKCGYRYDEAIKAGNSHEEIRNYMLREKAHCLR